jgi:hypothetical protein
MEVQRTPLPQTVEEAYEYAQKNCRIVPWAPYGQHIQLRCKNHPQLSWSTKNIRFIGARSVFFGLNGIKEAECSCSINRLEPVIPENWKDLVVPLSIIKCSCCKEELQEEREHTHLSCCECFDKRCGFVYYEKDGRREFRSQTDQDPCKAGKR